MQTVYFNNDQKPSNTLLFYYGEVAISATKILGTIPTDIVSNTTSFSWSINKFLPPPPEFLKLSDISLVGRQTALNKENIAKSDGGISTIHNR